MCDLMRAPVAVRPLLRADVLPLSVTLDCDSMGMQLAGYNRF